jgi:two-component sensor histidine kinase
LTLNRALSDVPGRSRKRRGRHPWVGVALVVLLAGFVAVSGILAAFRTMTARVEHSQQAQSTLERLQLAITDAESAQRGFLLTGSQAYLAPYDEAIATARWQVSRLEALTADHAAQQRNSARLRRLIEDKIDELMTTVKAANLEGPEAARAIVRTDRGQRLMADIRTLVAVMAAEEGSRLARRDSLANLLFALVIALLVGVIGVSLWISLRGVRGLERDFRAEHDEGEALGRTLEELRQRSQAVSETEARQKLLIRELHHRIRNMLATVQAIADATLRSASSVEAFREGFSARLSALGRTHGLLTEDGWEQVALRDLITREFNSFAVDVDTRAHIDGPEVLLPSEIALGLGMAFHELMTNALKFGALSVREGYVTVTWTTEPGHNADFLYLTWIEHGGPIVKVPERSGFGTRLLKRVLGRQLNGQVKIDYLAQGVQVTFKAVLPHHPTLGSGPLANAAQAERAWPA